VTSTILSIHHVTTGAIVAGARRRDGDEIRFHDRAGDIFDQHEWLIDIWQLTGA